MPARRRGVSDRQPGLESWALRTWPGMYQPDAAGSAGTAPVGPRDNFQVMAIGVGEVDTPPAVVVVDFARAVAHRVGPVLKPTFADAAENSVKIRLGDQEGVVLWANRAFGVGEVERDPVVEFHHVEMAEASRRWPIQHLGQEPSGHPLVGRPDDGVVELSSHAVLVDCAITVSWVGTPLHSIDHSQSINPAGMGERGSPEATRARDPRNCAVVRK